MPSVRRALLSASIIPIMLKGYSSGALEHSETNGPHRHSPAVPYNPLRDRSVPTSFPLRSRSTARTSRQAHPQAAAGSRHSKFLSVRQGLTTINLKARP